VKREEVMHTALANSVTEKVVSDERLCHHLDFEVARADALSAFYHPFANAAARVARGAPGAAIASRPVPKGDRR
jgi:hypothetical protein